MTTGMDDADVRRELKRFAATGMPEATLTVAILDCLKKDIAELDFHASLLRQVIDMLGRPTSRPEEEPTT